jgi:nucleotide-binding universal stress UspA family protein
MNGAVGPQVRHILCGVDGSDPACRAAEHAAWLAQALNAKLTFLAVAREAGRSAAIDAYRQTEGLGEERVPLMPREAEQCLNAAQSGAFTLGNKSTQRLIKIGKVAQTVMSVATEIEADLIVLGRHDHSELHRSIVGSVSRTIAAKSKLSILQIW